MYLNVGKAKEKQSSDVKVLYVVSKLKIKGLIHLIQARTSQYHPKLEIAINGKTELIYKANEMERLVL